MQTTTLCVNRVAAAGLAQVSSLRYLAGMAFLLLMMVGCSNIAERKPLPAAQILNAKIPGIPDARFWADEWPNYSEELFAEGSETDFHRKFSGVYNKPHNYVAISGGGANGAFGAGLFSGWTASGTRPKFAMVTGVSTGALTAPFVFLGSEYDAVLETVYTTTSTEDIAIERNFIVAALGDSMTDTKPLRQLIAKFVNAEVVEAIAREYDSGRRLYVGTVNLDAGRSVIWNIGAIASSDHPNKLHLIHEILRASAAIPIAFPPVVIPVRAAGKMYDEMHVDGGTGAQVFVYPAAVDWRKIVEKLKVRGQPKVYIIRNSFLQPDYQGVARSVLPIASRSIDSLIRTQGIGDLYQIYSLCERDGNDFNLAYIPTDFTEEPTEGFDPIYMKKLYDRGYTMGLNGYPWSKVPPGFTMEGRE